MIRFTTETEHKLGLERLVEGLIGRKPEFVYIKKEGTTDSFANIINRGKVPILVPENLIAFNKMYRENAEYLEFLVALQAGRLRYGSAAVNSADFESYWRSLVRQGLVQKANPAWGLKDFFATFEHRDYLAKQIFEIVESARVAARMKRDYIGFKQTLEEVISNKFQGILNGLGEVPKQTLDNMVLTLLQYKLLLGHLPQHKIKPKKGEHNTIRAAKKKGIDVRPFVEQSYDLLNKCYDIASDIFRRDADLGDSLAITKKLHQLIFENTKEEKNHSGGKVPPSKLDGLNNFVHKEHMIVASDIRKLGVFSNKPRVAEATEKETPHYFEWNSEERKYLPGFYAVDSDVHYSGVHRIIVPSSNLVNRLKREFGLLKPGGRAVLKKQRSGEIDYERFVEYKNDTLAGIVPDERIYQKVLNRKRDVAALVLVDLSGSTNRWINEKTKIIDVIAEAVYYLSCGASQLDDLVGVFGYSAHSRKRTQFFTIADFGKVRPDNDSFLQALSRITGQGQNHDGTAIRHATRKLMDTGRKNKLLIHISDGEPEAVFLQKDLYAGEKGLPEYKGEYAWQDVRKALSEARARGVLPVCIRVNDRRSENLERAYGAHYKILENPFNLQKVLCTTYKDLIT